MLYESEEEPTFYENMMALSLLKEEVMKIHAAYSNVRDQ